MLTYEQGSREHQFLGNGQSALPSKWVDTSTDLSPKRVTPLGGVHCCQPFLYWLIHMTHNRFRAHKKRPESQRPCTTPKNHWKQLVSNNPLITPARRKFQIHKS